jgi:hypothetical protein
VIAESGRSDTTVDGDWICAIPRLTRVAGFEWGTGFYINPVPPEQAAAFLKEIEVDVSGGRKE